MSTQITEAMVQQYTSNVIMLVQQKGSRLRPFVRTEPVVGENAFFERIGAVTAQEIVSRHADTPQLDTPHTRRRVSLTDYVWADLIDRLDRVRLLINPENPYAVSAMWAMGRVMDDRLIAAALGNAFGGKTGATTIPLPAGQKIAVAASGLTVGKLRTAARLLDAADVDPSIKRHIAVTARQLEDLLGDTTITSADFNTVRALVDGQVNHFMGFDFHHTERLTTDGAGDRQVIVWAEDGLVLATGQDPRGDIGERKDKNLAVQVFFSMAIGATRLEEEKVVEVACNEP